MNIIDELKPAPTPRNIDKEQKEFKERVNKNYDERTQEERDARTIKRTSTPEDGQSPEDEETHAPNDSKNIIVSFDILQSFRDNLKEPIKKDRVNEKQINREFRKNMKEQVKQDILNKAMNLKDDETLIITTGITPHKKTLPNKLIFRF